MMSHILIYRLRVRRRELEREIRRELARPAPDLGRVAKLERGKLAVKSELSRLESGFAPLTPARAW
ncbi:DUF465 domain-containing protein [Phenylobacterium sp.]|uniref:DUF465 domain-containing protein n=1 Tax=Phenylobacterium sp. TaxID=1871053 RepID=UPI002B69D01C|nr:DUF465 domain-containing protein [Phenylobacterium sp.]HVI34427.1 DUF465 domain-containing protein [Phenylobacterium sp.]